MSARTPKSLGGLDVLVPLQQERAETLLLALHRRGTFAGRKGVDEGSLNDSALGAKLKAVIAWALLPTEVLAALLLGRPPSRS